MKVWMLVSISLLCSGCWQSSRASAIEAIEAAGGRVAFERNPDETGKSEGGLVESRALEIIGYRIPNQGTSSNDASSNNTSVL